MLKSDKAKIRKKIYTIWWHIKDRCYNQKNPRYHVYGGNGVTLCSEWHEFNRFLVDIKELKGYSDFDILNGKIHLDKDSLDMKNKIYCKQKCIFIPIELNNKFKPNQMKPFKAFSPLGEEFIVYNRSEFARKNNLRQSTISDCLGGRVKKHKGWAFTFIE